MAFTFTQTNTRAYFAVVIKNELTNSVADLTGTTVTFYFQHKKSKTSVVAGGACVLTDDANGEVEYRWGANDLNVPGIYKAEFLITFADGKTQSVVIDDVVVQPSITPLTPLTSPLPGSDTQVLIPDGSLTAPGLAYALDTNHGLWRIGADASGFAGSLAFRGPSPWVDVRAYGAVGDGATDDIAAIQSALDAIAALTAAGTSSGTILFFPYGTYRISSSIRLNRGVILQGVSPGGWYGGSKILADDGVTAIIGDRFNTSTDGGRGDWSIVRNLIISAAAKTIANADGILMNARLGVYDCYITGFSRHGINITGNSPNTNANGWSVQRVRIDTCDGDGLHTSGTDANAGSAVLVDVASVGGWGFNEDSKLGNSYVACSTATCTTGSFTASATFATNQSSFFQCYVEGGQPAAVIKAPSVVVGGLLSTSTDFPGGTTTAGLYGSSTGGGRIMAHSLEIETDSGQYTTLSNPGAAAGFDFTPTSGKRLQVTTDATGYHVTDITGSSVFEWKRNAGGVVDFGVTATGLATARIGLQLTAASAVYSGAGAPSAGLGADGDFYLNQTGVSGARLYFKKSGAWVRESAFTDPTLYTVFHDNVLGIAARDLVGGSGSAAGDADGVTLATSGTGNSYLRRIHPLTGNTNHYDFSRIKFFSTLIRPLVSIAASETIFVGMAAKGSAVAYVEATEKHIGFTFDPAVSANWFATVSNGTAASTRDTGVAVVLNTDVLLAFEYDGTTMTAWVDGVNKGTIATANCPSGQGTNGLHMTHYIDNKASAADHQLGIHTGQAVVSAI